MAQGEQERERERESKRKGKFKDPTYIYTCIQKVVPFIYVPLGIPKDNSNFKNFKDSVLISNIRLF